jgi:hypothetical protein
MDSLNPSIYGMENDKATEVGGLTNVMKTEKAV